MKKILLPCIAIIAFVSGLQRLAAQPSALYKWFDPASSPFSVIEGRGWQQNELAAPYDRLPQKMEQLVRPPVWGLSHNTAGEYINFKTNATTIVIRYKVAGNQAMPHMPATGVSGVDLYAKDQNGKWQWARGGYRFGDTIEYRFNNLPLFAVKAMCRLYLPLYNTVTWMNIGVPSDAEFAVLPASKEKPVVLYGTSIMQGACASRPGLAWPNILGRKLNKPNTRVKASESVKIFFILFGFDIKSNKKNYARKLTNQFFFAFYPPAENISFKIPANLTPPFNRRLLSVSIWSKL